jgi:predicted  nucleic acid-binding Zn-ribbon protein
MMFSRKGVAEAAKELAAHLAVVDNVANLQKMQKEMADAIAKLNDRIKDMEANMRALKAEAKFEAVKETQQMLNSVQGAFHDKLTDLTVRISTMENQTGSLAPVMALPRAPQSGDGETSDQ